MSAQADGVRQTQTHIDKVAQTGVGPYLLNGRNHGQLTEEETEILSSRILEERMVPARQTLIRHGDSLDFSMLCVGGIISRFLDDASGRRQLLSIHFAGDFLDLHAYPLKSLDHDVGALTDVRVALMRHTDLETLQHEHPSIMRKLWFATLLDAALHRKWVWRLGRLRAVSRVAHFFCECHARLTGVGLSKGTAFNLGLTQADLADVSGLTVVHTNRVLRELRERGLATFRDSTVEISDLSGLWKLGQFDPEYLYLSEEALQRVWGHGEGDPLSSRSHVGFSDHAGLNPAGFDRRANGSRREA
ncbi:Crp/Fnr family transcriptional regulator [Notoacmeibacter sp. MSK16QG-6]|uniref:Crp/Fnr family transcriptional regulator n=1 Tax=Notoacmeibacter sp. MSK16QG-6 TaxID=2957982 RepID=UPI00209E956F|nr:Crp/Fnr family transcriptional regulator [Notoacmeibacter sp. MSK16QG-6]MCP1199749.1 Crp/Fnr family transcriptional regulator [Notoacmeibacter sp. MSK16QG-6]